MISIIKSLFGYNNKKYSDLDLDLNLELTSESKLESKLENKLQHFKNVLQLVPQKEIKICNQNYDSTNEVILTVINFCERNQTKSKKIVVSLSGGVDSMVLISILKFIGYEPVACHINYNNREETSMEQDFLEYWCNTNSIKLYIKTIVNLKRKNSKRSDYEYESKKIRFDFYKEVMKNEGLDCILLAHHKDDIIENIFANVCRGRYILDLAVIKEQSTINDVSIMRPLIELYKSSIYEFASSYEVPYFKDTTPEWSVRGKFRNKIYPLLEDTFSYNIKSNLLGLSKQSYEWNELVMEQIVKPFLELIVYEETKCVFNVEKYNAHPLCFWNIVFMKVFYYYNKNCPSRKSIQVFMNSIKTKNVCTITLSDKCLCKNKNNIITIEFNA
jgi:tRNA(Ile)-lysidine synthetase-like protein